MTANPTKTPGRTKLGVQESPRSFERDTEWVKGLALYKEFLAEREEILRHKWLESEKRGFDIGFERALLDWIMKHRSEWRTRRGAETERTSPRSSE